MAFLGMGRGDNTIRPLTYQTYRRPDGGGGETHFFGERYGGSAIGSGLQAFFANPRTLQILQQWERDPSNGDRYRNELNALMAQSGASLANGGEFAYNPETRQVGFRTRDINADYVYPAVAIATMALGGAAGISAAGGLGAIGGAGAGGGGSAPAAASALPTASYAAPAAAGGAGGAGGAGATIPASALGTASFAAPAGAGAGGAATAAGAGGAAGGAGAFGLSTGTYVSAAQGAIGGVLAARQREQDRELQEQESERDTALAESALNPFRHQLNQAETIGRLDMLEHASYAPVSITPPERYANRMPTITGGPSYAGPSDSTRQAAGALRRNVTAGQTAPSMTDPANFGRTATVDLSGLTGQPDKGLGAPSYAPGVPSPAVSINDLRRRNRR